MVSKTRCRKGLYVVTVNREIAANCRRRTKISTDCYSGNDEKIWVDPQYIKAEKKARQNSIE